MALSILPPTRIWNTPESHEHLPSQQIAHLASEMTMSTRYVDRFVLVLVSVHSGLHYWNYNFYMLGLEYKWDKEGMQVMIVISRPPIQV